MKSGICKFALTCVSLFAVFAVAGCRQPGADPVPVERLEIVLNGSSSIEVGESRTLGVNVFPPEASGYELEWTVSPARRATVDHCGTVTATAGEDAKDTGDIIVTVTVVGSRIYNRASLSVVLPGEGPGDEEPGDNDEEPGDGDEEPGDDNGTPSDGDEEPDNGAPPGGGSDNEAPGGGALFDVRAGAWFETVFAYWSGIPGASYNIYVSLAGMDDWRWVNNPRANTVSVPTAPPATGQQWTNDHSPLARVVDSASNRWRVDVPGLAANAGQRYDIRLVELVGGNPTGRYDIVTGLRPPPFDRQGFAFSATSPFRQTTGAYNPDGTLRDDAVVIYITAQNPNGFANPWNSNTGFAGNALFNSSRMPNRGMNTGQVTSLRDATPLVIRVIGTIPRSAAGRDMVPVMRTSNVTIEGIGPNAELNGFGLAINRSSNMVVRNLTFRNHSDDGIDVRGDGDNPANRNNPYHGPFPSLDEAAGDIVNNVVSFNTWITHNRFIVDNQNADGHIDTHRTTYFTISWNVFTANGRGGLSGNNDTNPHFRATYHNNHYVGTIQRSPRLRASETHVFNNFFEGRLTGASTYKVGAGHRANVIAEGNYFYRTNTPFAISGQGQAVRGSGGNPNFFTADQQGFIITTETTRANHGAATHQWLEDRVFDLAATLVPNEFVDVINYDPRVDQGFPVIGNTRGPGGAFRWTEYASPAAWPMPVNVTGAGEARARVLEYAGPMRPMP